MAKKNLNPTDIAIIYSFFKSRCESIIAGDSYKGSNDRKEYDEMNDQLSEYFKNNSHSNSELQEKYDRLILKGSWLFMVKSGYESAKYKKLASKLLAENRLIDNSEIYSKKVISKKPIRDTPNKKEGNSFNNIDEIIMRTATSYGLSGAYVHNEVSVLYKNGDLYTNPTKPLETFSIKESKKIKPKKWKTWKKNQGKIHVTNASTGKVYDWKKWFKTRPGEKGHTFNGVFKTLDPFGGSTVINASTVYFDNKGRFAWSHLKGGSWDMNSVYLKSKFKGTYYISNYTIHLNYENGQKESFFFCRFPVSNEHFIIGKSHFVPKN